MFFKIEFWAVIFTAFTVLNLLGASASLRAAILAVAGLVGLVLALEMSAVNFAVLAVSIGAVMLGAFLLSKDHAKFGMALLAVAPLGIAWILGKAASVLNMAHAAPLLFVGISYILVKAWSLLKDISDGKIEVISPIEMAAYFLHLPTFILGPMHQFTEFKASLDTPYKIDAERAIDCAFRFSLGLFKVYVLAGLLAPLSLVGLVGSDNITFSQLIPAAFVYSLVLYFDFSGYCDMAISTSRILGIDVPENFNWPYLASSIRDFWRRWHITFSRALTAHIFMPLARMLTNRFPKTPAWNASIGYIITFSLCGYWHGATANFILWGLWHAFGLITHDQYLRNLRARKKLVIGTKPLGRRVFDTALVFSFVSLGWIFFVLPIEDLAKIGGSG